MQPRDDRAPEKRARRYSEAVDSAPHAYREFAQAPRDGVDEEGEGKRHDRCAARPLDCSGDDERLRRRSEGASCRSRCKNGDSAGEDAAASESVAQCGHREEGRGEN